MLSFQVFIFRSTLGMDTAGKSDHEILKDIEAMSDKTCELKFKKDLIDATKLKALTFTMNT